MKTGIELIAEERQRQIDVEGWSLEHDDDHLYGTLAVVAAQLAVAGTDATVMDPLDRSSWGLVEKHQDRTRRLVIAGALIAAEIDREQRELSRS